VGLRGVRWGPVRSPAKSRKNPKWHNRSDWRRLPPGTPPPASRAPTAAPAHPLGHHADGRGRPHAPPHDPSGALRGPRGARMGPHGAHAGTRTRPRTIHPGPSGGRKGAEGAGCDRSVTFSFAGVNFPYHAQRTRTRVAPTRTPRAPRRHASGPQMDRARTHRASPARIARSIRAAQRPIFAVHRPIHTVHPQPLASRIERGDSGVHREAATATRAPRGIALYTSRPAALPKGG